MRRALLGFAAAVALGAVGVLLAGFMLPDTDAEMELGPVEAFPRSSVTSFYAEAIGEPWRRLSPGEVVGAGCARFSAGEWSRFAGMVVHLVRFEDGSFRALSGRSPHLGGMVSWYPELLYEGQRGWFREPCHHETFASDGTLVFGPAPRGLDRFDLRIEDGIVVVDPTEVAEGYRPPQPEVTPDPPGWTPQATEIATPSVTPTPVAP